MSEHGEDRPKVSFRDRFVLPMLVGGVAAVVTAVGFGKIGAAVVETANFNFWFDADSPLVFGNMTSRWGSYGNTSRHPLIVLLTFPIVKGMGALGAGDVEAVGALLTALSAAGAVLLHSVLRGIGLRALDAVMFSLLAVSSSCWIFWSPVPESYPLAGPTLLGALAVTVAVDRGRRVGTARLLAVGLVTLGITKTNWLAALIATRSARPWGGFARVAAATLGLVIAAWAVQRAFVPSSEFFIGVSGKTMEFVSWSWDENRMARLRCIFLHGLVLPDMSEPHGLGLSIQGAPWASGALSMTALSAWVALLAGGAAVAAARLRTHQAPRLLLVWCAVHVGLHLLFGTETFLFSFHVLPFLVVVAAHGALTRARPVVLTLAVLCLAAAAWNNLRGFDRAAGRLREVHDSRLALNRQLQDLGPRASVVRGEPVGTRSPGFAHVQDGGGWVMDPRHWRIENVEELRRQGATHFATSRRDMLDERPAFLDEIERRYAVVERTPRLVIYRLEKD